MFDGEVGRAFERSRQFGEFNILLNVRPIELALLPWELCFDKAERSFLVLRKGQGFIRIMDSIKVSKKLSLPKELRILHVYSNPLDMEPLSISKEALGRQGIVTDLGNATASKLRLTLSSGTFDILHFDGHGIYDQDQDLGFLYLQDKEGYAKVLSANVLGDYLAGSKIKLVILCGCETGRDGDSKRFTGVASHLIKSCEVPAVIAMQWAISDKAATAFNRGLYQGLNLGMNIEDAVVFARQAIREEDNLIQAFSPILLMR